MCNRYYLDDDAVCEVKNIVGKIGSETKNRLTGDIYPSQKTLVIIAEARELKAKEMVWGFPSSDQTSSDNNRLLINARAETVLERRMFRESVLHRRCAIPARGFYEWDADKNRASFASENGSALYLAGFYNLFQGQDHFVILTTEANSSVRPVHSRMPLLLEKQELQSWVLDDRFPESILKKTPPLLHRRQEYEQQKLFL